MLYPIIREGYDKIRVTCLGASMFNADPMFFISFIARTASSSLSCHWMTEVGPAMLTRGLQRRMVSHLHSLSARMGLSSGLVIPAVSINRYRFQLIPTLSRNVESTRSAVKSVLGLTSRLSFFFMWLITRRRRRRRSSSNWWCWDRGKMRSFPCKSSRSRSHCRWRPSSRKVSLLVGEPGDS